MKRRLRSQDRPQAVVGMRLVERANLANRLTDQQPEYSIRRYPPDRQASTII
jgi:hypothetical protein